MRHVATIALVDDRMIGVLRAGAAGYIRTDAEPEILLAAVRAVAQGKTFIDPLAGRHLARVDASDDLATREIEVLRQIALGRSNKDIPQS